MNADTFIYVGPTIDGVAMRNTVYTRPARLLEEAIADAPYLRGLCIPISRLSEAMEQIRRHNGAYYTLYRRAQMETASLTRAAQLR